MKKPFQRMNEEPDNRITQEMVKEDKRILTMIHDWGKLTPAQHKHFKNKERFIDMYEKGLIKHWYEYWKQPGRIYEKTQDINT